ncbi:MAG: hypothetical protein HYV95_11330 [Opitutae bacterium]|nr:hypothetical protein [Opitutae bacterium]
MSNQSSAGQQAGASQKPKPNHLRVAIVTTSGTYPEQDFDEVPINQPLDVQLKKAAKALGISDTAGWLAKVGNTVLDPNKSYQDLGLNGEVSIDYGPDATGGGNE